MVVLTLLWDALAHTLATAWDMCWALILGFTLSSVVQAVVKKEAITGLIGDDSPRSLAAAAGLGAASSSCSYAAVALARSLFRKGANFTAAIAFQIASTNLVLEIGIILLLLMGWQFTLAEFVGGPIMIILLAVMFRLWLKSSIVDAARSQAEQGLAGSMEGHAAMDMSVEDDRPLLKRLFSGDGVTAVSHIFVMEWAAVLRDIVIGLLIAGAIAAWVPTSFWQAFFLTDHPFWAKVEGPLVGPIVAVLSFVCSVGNIPLAAVLWNSGISFGGVVSFVFADLLIIPILVIYRKYYGLKMAVFLAATLYAASVLAGYLVEIVFGLLHLIPEQRRATVDMGGPSWNYTTWLNIVFLIVAAVLIIRFVRTGDAGMLKMMNGGPDDMAEHDHHH